MGITKLNFDLKLDGENRVNRLYEFEEFRILSYDIDKIYKQKTKRWHDKHIIARTFNSGEKVLLLNSRLMLFPRIQRFKRSGPFKVVRMTQHGAVKLKGETGSTFLVNG